MSRIVIFGNSGSGKSTLATRYAASLGLKHLDLDTIAWESPGIRRSVSESVRDLKDVTDPRDRWVVEGCYGSLLGEACRRADQLIFLNLSVGECQRNCRRRPWEPHKYDTPEDQDRNLPMLLRWVAEYETRTDEFSLAAHQEIFESFQGAKSELRSNEEVQKHLTNES